MLPKTKENIDMVVTFKLNPYWIPSVLTLLVWLYFHLLFKDDRNDAFEIIGLFKIFCLAVSFSLIWLVFFMVMYFTK